MQAEIEVDFGSYQLKFDLFWLRDHCRCEMCYDHSTFQRKISVLDIPDEVAVKSYEFKDAQLNVICEFYFY
jgi:trimethyllysine dioxygenase